MTYAKVTMLDQLPELEELEGDSQYVSQRNNENYHSIGLDMIPNQVADKYKKNIRDSFTPRPESGMVMYDRNNNSNEGYQEMTEHYESVPVHHAPINEGYGMNNRGNRRQSQINNDAMIEPMHREMYINCIDFANHVKGCPICSKLYNTDKTLYVITIICLVLICLYLLKKIANI
jgi:hypothetical protein